MKLTNEQFQALAKYEDNFRRAINAKWAMHPGQNALVEIHSIFTQATGDERRLNGSCQACILHLIQDAGAVYFADKAEREERKAVELNEANLAARKVALKTKKIRNTNK